MGKMPEKPVNQLAVSRALGSTVQPIGHTAFGGFGVIRTAAEVLRHKPKKPERPAIPPEADRLIARAFEEMRNGCATDRVLWDRTFGRDFVKRCRKLGLDLPEAMLKRRLIAIRKSPSRFRQLGIVLSPTTRRDLHNAPPDRAILSIEYALVRLRYRHGVSIDDILIDPALAEEFETMALSISPELSSEDLRLGALYIRKTLDRARAQDDYAKLDLSSFEAAMDRIEHLSECEPRAIPEAAGLLKLSEEDRCLFVGTCRNLRGSVDPLLDGSALKAMGDRFWQPEMSAVGLSVYVGTRFADIPIQKWRIKLIHDRRPVFNWPVLIHAA